MLTHTRTVCDKREARLIKPHTYFTCGFDRREQKIKQKNTKEGFREPSQVKSSQARSSQVKPGETVALRMCCHCLGIARRHRLYVRSTGLFACISKSGFSFASSPGPHTLMQSIASQSLWFCKTNDSWHNCFFFVAPKQNKKKNERSQPSLLQCFWRVSHTWRPINDQVPSVFFL